MPYSPTTVSRLESELCKAGLSHIGYTLELDPTANDDGHQYYDGVMTAKVRGVVIDFEERYSQRGKVEMRMHVPAEKLEGVCKAISDTHKSATERIGIKAIVTVKTAIAVCKALDGMDVDG